MGGKEEKKLECGFTLRENEKKDDSEHTPFICHLLVLRRSIPPEQNVKHECTNHKHLVGKVCRRVEVRTAVHVSIIERHTGWPEDKYLPTPLEAIILFLYVDRWRSQACKEFRQHRHGIGTGKRGPGPLDKVQKAGDCRMAHLRVNERDESQDSRKAHLERLFYILYEMDPTLSFSSLHPCSVLRYLLPTIVPLLSTSSDTLYLSHPLHSSVNLSYDNVWDSLLPSSSPI